MLSPNDKTVNVGVGSGHGRSDSGDAIAERKDGEYGCGMGQSECEDVCGDTIAE